MFLTNAQRSASAVATQFTSLGMPARLTRMIVSSGNVAINWLTDEGAERVLGFLGGPVDRERLLAAGISFDDRNADTVVCSGFDARGYDVESYREELLAMSAIGDSIKTDFIGAVAAEVPFVFVSCGIDRAAYAAQFEKLFDRPSIMGMRPLAVVEALA